MPKRKSRGNKQPVKPSNSPQQNNVVAAHHQVSYSGPLPPAEDLKKYDMVVSGAAERILVMAEKNQAHQISIESTALDAKRKEVLLGQIFALTISLCAFGTAIAAMIMGHPTVAGVIGGTTVVSLAIAFITGRKPRE